MVDAAAFWKKEMHEFLVAYYDTIGSADPKYFADKEIALRERILEAAEKNHVG